MSHFFISDLHLGPNHPELFEHFRSFMQHIAPQATALYILGDFFEYWVGADLLVDYQNQIIAELANYSQRFPIYFMTGNRDFLLTADFYQRSGCHAIEDPSWIRHHNQSILLLHGDSLCTDRLAYRLYRSWSHKPSVQQQFLRLPARIREKIAHWLRGKEMTHCDDFAKDVPGAMLAELIQLQKPNIIIHGHTHYPMIELHLTAPHYTRYVLAAWGKQGNTLKLNPQGQFELVYF